MMGELFTLLSLVCLRFILLLLVLFVIPGVVMIVAYGLISRELYRGIQFEMGQKKESTSEKLYFNTVESSPVHLVQFVLS